MTGTTPPSRSAAQTHTAKAAVLAFALLCILAIVQKSFSLEEALSMDAATRPLRGVLHQSLTFENQSPNYYLLLHAWTRLSESILFSRLLSLGMVAVAVVMILRAASTLPEVQPTIAALLLVLCPPVIWAGTEIRSYPLAFLTVSATWLMFARTWFGASAPGWGSLVTYFAACYLAVTSFYYAVFVIAGQWLAALLFSRHRRQLIVGGLLYTVAFLPWIPIIITQFTNRPTLATHVVAAIERSRGLTATLRLLTQILVSSPISDRFGFNAGWLLLVATIAAAALFGKRHTLPKGSQAVLAAVVVSIAIPWILWSTKVAVVYARHWIPVVPGALLALALLLSLITLPSVRIAMTAAVAAAFVVGDVSLYRNLSPVNWKGLARQVEDKRDPAEPVLFFPSRGMLIYSPYLKKPGGTFGLPSNVQLVRYPLDSSMAIRRPADISARLLEVGNPGGTFWLVVDPGFQGFGDQTLSAFVTERCQVLDSVQASGLRARRLHCS